MIPLTDSPYTDYMVLTFNKDGLFKEALNILHATDDSYVEDLSINIDFATKKLREAMDQIK